jgi:hypothetical protein
LQRRTTSVGNGGIAEIDRPTSIGEGDAPNPKLPIGTPELLTSDHQNKPDVGAQKFREWADGDAVSDLGARREWAL